MRLHFFIILFFIIKVMVGQQSTVCVRATMLLKTVQKHHYNPRPVDDEFSKMVFEEFLKGIDPKKRIFTEENIRLFKKRELLIDDDLRKENCDFVSMVTKTYQSQIQHLKANLIHLQKSPFQYQMKQKYVAGSEIGFLNQDYLDEFWKKKMKLHVLNSYYSPFDSVPETQPTIDELFQIQKKIIDQQLCDLEVELKEKDIEVLFLKAISFSFDPHSTYFSPEQESEFTQMLSKESYSFGFSLNTNDIGEYEITYLVPGSPAWKSNRLNEGDVILGLKTNKQKLDINGCDANDKVSDFFNQIGNQKTTFIIRKQNGDVLDVELSRAYIEVEENIIQSFILDGDVKIGYLYLPSFYTSSDNGTNIPNGCANDIAKELIKLKREGIEGLVLDLRDNGGGSMLEAIRLAGIFIDYGSVCMVDSRLDDPVNMKDMDKGILFNKPLIVMVNSFSASASELFAAAIQDYHRGVIVGTTTYGKSTAQSVLPLKAYRDNELVSVDNSPNGFIKLTHSKFYRITGQSHQNEGVVPDIYIPEEYQYLKLKESNYTSSLKATTIDKKSYYKPLTELPIQQLKSSSQKRIETNLSFKNIEVYAKEYAQKYEHQEIPIDYEGYCDYFFSSDDEEIKFETVYEVTNPSYIRGVSDIYNSDKEINENVMQSILEDVTVNESYKIITELINLKK